MLKTSSIFVVLLVNLACVFGQFDIEVKIFTRDNMMNPYVLNNSMPVNMSKPVMTCFSPDAHGCEYYMIIHGFQSNSNQDWVVSMKNALFTRNQNSTVFVVDWSAGADLSIFRYKYAADNLRYVYPYLYSLMKNLIDIQYLKPDWATNTLHFHCIGHSLGAHGCGFLGKAMLSSLNLNLSRISGLDPAGPCFDPHYRDNRLDYNDAVFVDVIHTSSSFGMIQSIGDADFYPNQGIQQLDCWPWPLGNQDELQDLISLFWCSTKIDFYAINQNYTYFNQAVQQAVMAAQTQQASGLTLCSHAKAIAYYIESINSACKFVSHQCSSWDNYKKNLCQNCDTNNMGFPSVKKIQPTHFYMDVNSQAPFCIAATKSANVSITASITTNICFSNDNIFNHAGRFTSTNLQSIFVVAVSFLLVKVL